VGQLIDRLQELLNRVHGYRWYEVALELAVIWVMVYVIFRFLRGTRGARVIKGVALVLIIVTLMIRVLSGDQDRFERLRYLFNNFLSAAFIALVVVFQPELRRALVRLGEVNPFGGRGGLKKARVIEELLGAVAYLSKNKIGALVAIERQVGLRGVVEAGTRMDAEVSRELLNTIFWPGSALHDMGVVIQGDRIVAAGVQFPLAEGESVAQELGSRHRAAIGLSQEADCLVVVVSEETGTISVAERGVLERDFTIDGLRTRLVRGLGKADMAPATTTEAEESGASAEV
jgi:diadenylate cyclase